MYFNNIYIGILIMRYLIRQNLRLSEERNLSLKFTHARYKFNTPKIAYYMHNVRVIN